MPTPEEVLEDVLRLRWPKSIPENEYAQVYSVLMGFGALIRPEGSTRMKRMREQNREAQHEEGTRPELPRKKGERVEALLKRGEPISTMELAAQAGCTNTMASRVARIVGAKRVGRTEDLSVIWRLAKVSKAPKAKEVRKFQGTKGRAPALELALEKLRPHLKRGEWLNLGPLTKKAGLGAGVMRKAALMLGGKMAGIGPHARWTLPPKKKAADNAALLSIGGLTNGATAAQEAAHALEG